MTQPLDILYILAHPDDESFGHAGTMILANQMGFRTGYICATRGEAGEIRDSKLSSRAALGARRELELRNAMELVGLDELRIMSYRDSGMDGSPLNEDPRCLIQADEDEVAAFLIADIRALKPKVVVTFGPDGVYGHPDHIRIGKITDRAVLEAAGDGDPGLGEPWRVEAFYHVAAPRERMIAGRTNPESPLFNAPMDVIERMGNPAADITHWIDTRSVLDQKYDVLMQHATQISANNPISDKASELGQMYLGTETLLRRDLPWDEDQNDPVTQVRDKYPAK